MTQTSAYPTAEPAKGSNAMKRAMLALLLLFTTPATAQSPPSADAPGAGAIVQVALTYVDVPAKDLSRLGSTWNAVGMSPNALEAMQALAAQRHVPLTLVPTQALVTADGQTGQIQSIKRIPYGGKDMFGYNFAVVNGTAATPHVNADGTVTIHLVLKQSGRERPRPGDGKQSVTTEMSVDTTRRFRPGDSLLIAGPLPDIVPPRFVFASVTLLSPAKP